MISVRLFTVGGMEEADPIQGGQAIEEPGHLVWVDAVDPDDHELCALQGAFGLDVSALDDIRERHPRPTLAYYRGHALIVAYSATMVEVDFVIGPNWLITVREEGEAGARWPLDEALRRYERVRCGSTSAGFLLYVLLDALVDGHVDATDELDTRIGAVEERVFGDDGDQMAVQQELYALRRKLLTVRHAVAPLRDVIAALLRREVEWVHSDAIVHLQDVYDHVLRVVDIVDTQRELVGNAVDGHLAIISNQLTFSMKKMTSWGAILLGSTLVAGVYGMNFANVPELGWRFGTLWALGIMAALTVTGYLLFRARNYL
jgi:magnesium transporter